MSTFTILLFDWDDRVLSVEPVTAPDAPAARQVAEALLRIHPEAAGWQLWHAGRKLFATFPHGGRQRPALTPADQPR